MAKTRDRVYKMDLSEFHRYLGDKAEELEACQKQTEKVQARLDVIFKRELAAWQEVFGYCYPKILEERAQLPSYFAALLDRVEREELERIRDEIATLEQTAIEGRVQMDELTAQGQSAVKGLSLANPNVNNREEKLKAEVVRYQDEYARAYEEMDKLDDSPLGWLVNAGKISKLKKVQRDAKKKQDQAMVKLRSRAAGLVGTRGIGGRDSVRLARQVAKAERTSLGGARSR